VEILLLEHFQTFFVMLPAIVIPNKVETVLQKDNQEHIATILFILEQIVYIQYVPMINAHHYQLELQHQLHQLFTKELLVPELPHATHLLVVLEEHAKNGLDLQLEEVALHQMIVHQETYVFQELVQPKLELLLEDHALKAQIAALKQLQFVFVINQLDQLENVHLQQTQMHLQHQELQIANLYTTNTKMVEPSQHQMQQLHIQITNVFKLAIL